MENEEKRYNLEEAQEEAEELRKKVESGEANDYHKAHKVLVKGQKAEQRKREKEEREKEKREKTLISMKERIPADWKLGKKDFLHFEEALKEMGINVYRPEDASSEIRQFLESKEYRDNPFPSINRGLVTGYNTRNLEEPDRIPDRVIVPECVVYDRYFIMDEWCSVYYNNPDISLFYEEGVGIIKGSVYSWDSYGAFRDFDRFGRVKDGRTYNFLREDKDVCELPTHIMDRPFYSAGGRNNPFLYGGDETSAYAIPPIKMALYFDRLNPIFVQYVESTLRKVEETTLENLVETHMQVIRKYNLNIPEEAVRIAAKEYFEKQIPLIKNVGESILHGIKVDIPYSLIAYEDSVLIFMGTRVPMMPLPFIKMAVQKANIEIVIDNVNAEYEHSFMEEFADPEAIKYRWVDLASSFTASMGSASKKYNLIDPEKIMKEHSVLMNQIQAEEEAKKTKEERLKEEERLRQERIKQRGIEREAMIDRMLENIKITGSIKIIRQLANALINLQEQDFGEDFSSSPSMIYQLDSQDIFATKENRQTLQKTLRNEIEEVALTAKSGIPTIILSWAEEKDIRDILPDQWDEIKSLKNFLFLRLPISMQDLVKEWIKLCGAQ